MLVPGDGKVLLFLHIVEVATGKVLNIKFLHGYGRATSQAFDCSSSSQSQTWQPLQLCAIFFPPALTRLTQLVDGLMMGKRVKAGKKVHVCSTGRNLWEGD